MQNIPPPVLSRANVCQRLLLPSGVFWFACLIASNLHAQSCNDFSIVSFDEDCAVPITPDMVLEGVPNDSAYTVHLTTLAGAPIGTMLTAAHLGDTVRATVTHSGTGNSCWGLLLAVDHLPPVLQCADLVLPCAVPDLSPNYLAAAFNLTDASPNVLENCGPYNLAFSDTRQNFGCADPQNRNALVLRTWTAVDASGNQATCIQRLTIQNVSAAEVLFPTDTAVSCLNPNTHPLQTGQPYLVFAGVALPLFTTATTCALGIGFQDQVLPRCGASYNVLRTWTIHDDCQPSGPNNPRKNTVAIAVEDKTGPVFLQCPKDTVVSTDPFQCNRTLDLRDVVLWDACSTIEGLEARWTVFGQTHVLAGELTDFPGNNLWHPDTLGVLGYAPDLPAGEVIPFTYIATDVCGNTATCSFRVTVADGTPPFAVCDEFTQVALGGSGEAFVWASTFDDGTVDNCAHVRFKARRAEPNTCQPNDRFYDAVKFCCDDVGKTITVILRVYDVELDTGAIGLTTNEQHASECEVQVLVEDKLRPVCVPLANLAITCNNFDPTLKSHGTPLFYDNCCLDTVFELPPNYVLFDTLCNRGTITRTFRAFDCHGLSTQCTQRIFVQYQQTYAIQFPDDVVVNDCDTTGTYTPAPIVHGAFCENLGISYQDAVNYAGLLSCYWIERYWKVINWCYYNPNLPLIEIPNPNPSEHPLDLINMPGPVVAPKGHNPPPTMRRVTANDPFPTDFSTFWSAQANGYAYRQIIIVRDKEPPTFRGCPVSTGPVEICDHTTNDPNYWNAPYWSNPHIPGSNDICEGATELAATANDACAKGNLNIRYLLYLDLDHDGIVETVISSINPPPPGMVYFGNLYTPNFSGGVLRQFDQRPVPPEEKYRFTIVKGGFANITGYVRWVSEKEPTKYITPQLPHGIHRIQWIADDGCGNEAICAYDFQVRDCRAPDLVCIHGLSTDMPIDQTMTLYAPDFVHSYGDNCSPASEVEIGIRKAGSGHGFPRKPDGTPQQDVRFDCTEIGKQFVELWAMDHAGNMSVCQTYVIVQDNFLMCSDSTGVVAGVLKTDQANGLEDALVEVSSGLLPGVQMILSDASGQYLLPNVPLGAPCTITPTKDNDALNGVSTYDLSLINKHILGLETLNGPYRIIAADVNNSRSVTTFDVLELRKLILGIYTDFPQSTSWRFVDADYLFPNLYNPFQEIFPEIRQITNLQTSALSENFVAIKIGDVSGNALTSSLWSTDDRTAGTALFDVLPMGDSRTMNVQAGQIVEVSLRAADRLESVQFTLLHPGLEVFHLEPGTGVATEHFAVFRDAGAITVSWDGAGRPAFALRFRAKASGSLEQMLRVSSSITRAEAYGVFDGETEAPTRMAVALRFDSANGPVVQGQAFEVYPNEPNPWRDKTRIRFFLPEAAEVALTVQDQTGRQVWSQTRWFEAGIQQVVLDGAATLPAAGLYVYQVEVQGQRISGKMVKYGH